MATIPAEAAIRDKVTGQVLGTTAHPVTLSLWVNLEPMVRALSIAQASVCTVAIACGQGAEAMRQFLAAFGRTQARLETLRRQARRKGRPGWRHIAIPNHRPRSATPFAHQRNTPDQGATAPPKR